MEFKISRDIFSEKFAELYVTPPKYDFFKSFVIYHVQTFPRVVDQLGLKYVRYYFENGFCIFLFKITDEKKWMLTKIKYGI